MFRAFAARRKSDFDERHDLERLYETSRLSEYVSEGQTEQIGAAFSTVLSTWHNSQRYFDYTYLRTYFRKSGLSRGMRGDPVKAVTKQTLEAALKIVSIGEAKWTPL